MAQDIASLKISVDSRDVNNAKKDLDNLSNSSSKTEQSTNKLTSSFKGLGIALSAVTATALAKQFIETADAMNLLEARLKLLTNSTSEFISQQKIMAEIAKGTYSNIQDITKLYTKLDPALKQLGASTQGVNKVSENFAKSLKLGGASAAEASAAILQFAQAMGSGVLRGDEFNSMAEASPKLMQYMADGMGVPQTALRKMAEEGKLTADVVASALLKMSEQIDKDFKTLPLVVSAATTNLITDVQNMVHEFDSITGASSSVAQSIKELSDSISSNTTFMPTAIQFYYDAKTALTEMGYAINGTGLAFTDILSPLQSVNQNFTMLQDSTTGVISFIATMNAALSNSAIMFKNAGIEAAQWYKFITFADDADAFIVRTNKEIEANRAKIKTLEEIGNAGLEAANKTREAFQLSDEIKNGKELNKIYEDFNSALDDVLETQEFSAEQEIENITKTSKLLTKKHTATKAELKEIEKLKKEAQDAENDLAKEGFKIQQEFRDKNHKENQKALSVINEKTKQQQSDNEAFLKIIESETDKINKEYLKIYETQKLIASPEQLEAFYKKWQSEIDNIKPPKDDFQKWGDTLNSSISNALVDALKDGDVMGAVKGLGASISASMIQSSVSNIASGKGDIMSMGGLGGIATGMAISGFVSLFDSPKRKSNEEKAQEAFEKFIKGLNDSKIALESFGSTGSSIGEKVDAITKEADKLIANITAKYGAQSVGFAKTIANVDFGSFFGFGQEFKELAKLQNELNTITLDGLTKSLDYSKLSSKEIDGIITSLSANNADFSIEKYEELKKELEDFAIAAKANGGVMTNAARVQQILSNEIYKTGEDYKAVIDIKKKADEDAIASTQAVTDASIANIKAWGDSFKTPTQLAEDMAKVLGVTLATSTEDLSALFIKLSTDADGLTDADLVLANANKSLIQTFDDLTASTKAANAAAQQSNIDAANSFRIGNMSSLENLQRLSSLTGIAIVDSVDMVNTLAQQALDSIVNTGETNNATIERIQNQNIDNAKKREEYDALLVKLNDPAKNIAAVFDAMQAGLLTAKEASLKSATMVLRDKIEDILTGLVDVEIPTLDNTISEELRANILAQAQANTAYINELANATQINNTATQASTQAIQDNSFSLQQQLDVLNAKDDADKIAIQHAQTLLGLNNDNERAIQNLIFAREDEITALNKAKTIAEQGSGLQQQIDILTGLTTQRAVELKAINLINQPLQERIWLLEDEKIKTEAVNVALETSKNNIKAFADGLLSSDNLVKLSVDELSALFTKLSTDTDGLTDADLSLLNANKELTASTTDLDKTLSDTVSNISTLESAFDRIKNTIDGLRGSSKTAEENLQDFYTSMEKTKALSVGTDYEAYSKSLDETINAVSFLANQDPENITRDMQFAQLVAANQFEELGVINLTQTDYLKQIEENTRNQITALVDSINALGANILSALESSAKQKIVEKPLVGSSGTGMRTEVLPSGESITMYIDPVRQTSPTIGSAGISATSSIPFVAGHAYATGTGSKVYLDSAAELASWVASGSVKSFAVGTPSVPYDMYAKIHQGEMIVPKTFNEGLQSGNITIGQNNNDSVVRELNILNQKQNAIITILRESNDIHNVNLQINTMIQEAS